MAVLSQDEINRGLNIRNATVEDLSFLQTIVIASYSKYIERMGKPPAPMLLNYNELPKDRDIFILEIISEDKGSEIVGAITLVIDDTGGVVNISNVVVGPAAQGRGYGRTLMDFAEAVARERGINSLALYTNEKMHENISLYPKFGYIETERKSDDGYNRVFFRKQLKD
ncbi:acyl-CoA N-acyltransferase [Trichoderma evansii]